MAMTVDAHVQPQGEPHSDDGEERTRLEPIRRLPVVEAIAVIPEDLYAKVSEIAMRCFRNLDEEMMDTFLITVRSLLTLVLAVDGGSGFLCAPSESYQHLSSLGVDMTVLDDSKKYRNGYMTQQLNGEHITSRKHQERMRAFAKRGAGKRWPEGHEAAHLTKDGYNLYGASGFCRLAAACVVGLPAACNNWERVGMRHTTALQLCSALRGGRAAVVAVRSDSGTVHVLCPCEETVEVMSVTL